jgi:hypothetical protein
MFSGRAVCISYSRRYTPDVRSNRGPARTTTCTTMPTTHTITTYTFAELSAEAQERAIENARDDQGFRGEAWSEEWRDTIQEAERVLPFGFDGWEVESSGSGLVRGYALLDDADAATLSGVRAWKWLQNNGVAAAIGEPGSMPFTGYCGDEALLDPLRAFLARPDESVAIENLAQDCLESWALAWSRDMEYQYSDEAVREELSNRDDIEYLETGAVFRG